MIKSDSKIDVANLIIRGERISDNLVEMGGRDEGFSFLTPDVNQYIGKMGLASPRDMGDLYELSFDDILAYLDKVGRALDANTNPYLERARKLCYETSPLTPEIIDEAYVRQLGPFFSRDVVYEMANELVGIPYLEGWVDQGPRGNGVRLEVRCFGARILHIIAGNVPSVAAHSVVNTAILRGDAIIKTPSNDPFTALGIAETMCDIEPGHPITRHLTVGYWKGGDTGLEEKLYQPHNIEKIVAWGGFNSVKHVTKYIQPGLELISMDPKRSSSIVGAAAFADEASMREAAARIASDFCGFNQVGCSNARVIYVQSGTDEAGIEKLNQLGQMVYDYMPELPASFSTRPKHYNRELKSSVDTLRLVGDWYKVIGGEDGEGAVIVSQLPDPVEFATSLEDRTCNLVPMDSLDEAIDAADSYTQTVGIYPEELKREVMDRMPLCGAQRFVSLGYAMHGTLATPQDGLELSRRMAKWIANEISDPEIVTPPWLSY